MPSFTSIVALSAIMAASSVFASPVALTPRAEICGTTPSGSGSQTPISSPTGITTAEACQAQYNSASSCLSFVFGMVNGVDECMLYSVAASSLPKTSSNLVAYDKACTSVPAVVPTTANPQGLATTTASNNNNGVATNNGAKQNRDVDLISRAICGSAPPAHQQAQEAPVPSKLSKQRLSQNAKQSALQPVPSLARATSSATTSACCSPQQLIRSLLLLMANSRLTISAVVNRIVLFLSW